MAITMQRMKMDGMECVVHRLPPNEAGTTSGGYGMRIVGFGRGGRCGPGKQIPRFFEFYCISHLFEGRGFYWTPKGGRVSFEPGTAVLMQPDFAHCYGGDGESYVEDTVCFCGPLVESLAKAGLLEAGLASFGLERRLLPVIEKAMDPRESAQIEANVELQRIILSLACEKRRPKAGAGAKERISGLIEELKLSPERWWTVEEMARSCALGEVQFRRLFQELAGMAPKHYAERLKMQRAIEMLVGGRLGVAETGRRLGYADPFHFSRRFKALTGLAPADYQRSMGS